jgi:putative membrane protein
MLWVKAFHVIFVTSWFAGLFYLPRLFVNHAMETNLKALERLSLMENKLYRFMFPLAFLALTFGIWLWLGYGISGEWLHAKLALVAGLVGYHLFCGKLMRDLQDGKNIHSHVWYRWFNEIPVLILFAVVVLVIVKPF